MKLFFKRNIAFIVVVIIFLAWGLYAAIECQTVWKQREYAYDYHVQQCENEYKGVEEFQDRCQRLVENGRPMRDDTISMFFDMIGRYTLRNLQMIGPLFIIVMAIWNFHKELKSGFYKNVLTRMDYKKYVKKSWLKSLKYIFFYPVFLIYIFLLAFLISGHFDIQATLQEYPGSLYINPEYLEIFPIFMFVYIFNLMLHSIFWINMGFILTKKGKNILITLIASFLTYIAIFMIGEIFVGGFFLSLMLGIHNAGQYMNLANIWAYADIDNIFIVLAYGAFLAIVSTLILGSLSNSVGRHY